MIAVPQGFAVVPGVDRMTLIPPGGPRLGFIRYKERIRPLLRLGGIVHQQLSACPGFHLKQLGTPERLVTQEGEHAALIEITGEEDGQPAVRFLGVVFGDDFYALTSALCLEPAEKQRQEWGTLVRSLVLFDTLGLGTLRRRRYEYQPPAGWEPFASGFVTDWVPADFPREAAAITAFSAVPRQQTPEDLFTLWLKQMEAAGGVISARQPPVAVKAHSGLPGQHFAAVVQGKRLPLQRHLIILEDSCFTYAMTLKVDGTDVGPYLAVFEQVAGSIEAVPGGTSAVHSLVRHWIN